MVFTASLATKWFLLSLFCVPVGGMVFLMIYMCIFRLQRMFCSGPETTNGDKQKGNPKYDNKNGIQYTLQQAVVLRGSTEMHTYRLSS